MIEFFKNLGIWLYNNLFEPIINFFNAHKDNPLLWIGILVIGLLISKITYDALEKRNNL